MFTCKDEPLAHRSPRNHNMSSPFHFCLYIIPVYGSNMVSMSPIQSPNQSLRKTYYSYYSYSRAITDQCGVHSLP